MDQSKGRKNIQLLAVSKDEKLKYFIKCKITVNKITEELIIKPKNSEKQVFTIKFDQNFVKKKKFLCIFSPAEDESSYILILPNKEKCLKVYDSIYTEQINTFKYNEKELFKQLLLPLFYEIQENAALKKIAKEIADILIPKFSANKFSKWLKEANIEFEMFNKVFGVKIKETVVVEPVNEKQPSSRKRLANGKNAVNNETGRENDHENYPPSKKHKTENINEIFKQNIACNNFEIIKYEDRGKAKTNLIVFASAEKLLCFEYYWDNRLKLFKCCGCKIKAKNVHAEICKRNGKDFVKPNSNPHICDLRNYNREKYVLNIETQIVKASNFEFVSYVKNGSSRQKLIVFFNAEKEKCYEYIFEKLKKIWLCAGCNLKHKRITAKIFEHDGSDVIKLSALKHVCEPRTYKPQTFTVDEKNQIIKEPNFEILDYMEDGISKRNLYIFKSIERKYCYEYYFYKSSRRFECKNCKAEGITVVAKICEKDEKTYVQLNSTPHICDLLEYDPDKYTFDSSKQIIESKNYEIVEYFKGGIQRKALIVFDPTNKKLCYEYYWREKSKKYVCCGCLTETVCATVCKNDDNNEYIKLSKSEHFCALREFDPKKYPTKKIVKPPGYRILKRKYQEKMVEKLVIFDENDATLCYEYTWSKGHNYYICNPCINQHKQFVSANIFNPGKENEYLELSQKQHKCELQKFVVEPPEKKIIKKPDFKTEIYKDKDGNERTRLVIFDKNDKNLCHIFTYSKGRNCYKCNPCMFKHVFVSAKLLKNENGEDYLEMNDAEHICKPKKAEKIIVNLPNFKMETFMKNGKERKIIKIFDPNDKKIFYRYYYGNAIKCFYCYLCTKTKKKKHLSAKLKQNENGEDYLELNSMEHVCQK